MSPIRVGIIGVGNKVSEQYSPGEWGTRHMFAVLANPKYELVAISNSSVESAQKSIAFHGLDVNKVKAYGSAADLAADPNVDLVVVAVSTATKGHEELVKPAIEAGKDVYVEFPLAPSHQHVEDMVALARSKGVKTIAGSQAHSQPVIAKLRELVNGGEIGEVVSTVLLGTSPVDVSGGWLERVAVFVELEAGGSRVKIVLGHMLGGFNSVVGGFAQAQSVFKNMHPTTTLLDDNFQPVKTNYPATAPDHMLIQGVLESGAAASVNVRFAQTPVDDVGFRWLIAGTAGEIEMVAKPGIFQMDLSGATIRLRKRGEDTAKVIDWEGGEAAYIAELDPFSQSVAHVYAAFADGRTSEYATFETALKIHQTLEKATKDALWASK